MSNLREKILILFNEDENYKGEHESPDKSSGYPLYNVIGAYPKDFYESSGLNQYSADDPESYYIVKSSFKKPNIKLIVYRSIPKNIKSDINPGDWVTLNKKYAIEHGKDNLRGNYKIISKNVHARDLFTDGNSISEWGYDPQPEDKNEKLKSQIRNKLKQLDRIINGDKIIGLNKYENDMYFNKSIDFFQQMKKDIQEKYKNIDYII